MTIPTLLIGAGGNMRNAHLPRLSRLYDVEIVGVADPVESQASALIAKAGTDIPYYADWRTMLGEVDAKAVLISTPHRDHYEQVRACLDKGCHVLVEKPMVIDPRHAVALLEAADAGSLVLSVAYQRHWMPHFVYAKELIQGGAIGDIRGVVGYVSQNWTNISGWRLDPKAAGGGMFMDTGSHLVASMLWVTGLAPVRVSGTFDNAGFDVDINGGVTIEFDGGAVGTLATFGNAKHHDERLAITGSSGSLVLHLHQWQVRTMLHDDAEVTLPRRVAAATPDSAFFDAIRHDGEGHEPPTFALQVARLTEAAYRSARNGTPVDVQT